ncbi:MAG: hypothetical protein ACMVP2_21790 [Imperialibacter sp.]|uniref:hypothetical protein n=1 Tax=Imperialibacter sp. TaxID=2038411 RepID=UPI003A849E8F
MNYLKTLSIFLTLLSVCSSCQNSEESNLALISDQRPLDTPLIFGQGTISTDNKEFGLTFNPTMNELFFYTQKAGREQSNFYHEIAIRNTIPNGPAWNDEYASNTRNVQSQTGSAIPSHRRTGGH